MGSPKKRIQYRYDSVGNRVGMTDPDGGRFTYTYDAVNRITQVINPQGDRTSYAYDAGGRRTVKKLANGTRASFSYDAASNLTRLANLKSDGTTISSFNYDYDRVGNRTAVLEADGSRVTWSYDDTYQLTGEHRSGTTPYEDSYTYDAAGNRLLKIHDGARTTYAYDAANQLEWSEDASGRTTYTFDADGNQQLVVEPTGDRTTTSWDYENRTTLVQLPSGIRNTMAYEPGGLRVKLEESTGTKKFVWDEQNYLVETDENDDSQVVYTIEPRLYGNLVSQRRGTDSHWYHFDVIGSTRELTDVGETVTDTRLYDAWGYPVSATGTTRFPFQYVGNYGYFRGVDRNSLYVRGRWLSPSIARWQSVDPIASTTARLSGRCSNAYSYAELSPPSVVDPSGLDPYTYLQVDFPDGVITFGAQIGGGASWNWIWKPARAVRVTPTENVSGIQDMPNEDMSLIQKVSGNAEGYTGGRTGYDTVDYYYTELYGVGDWTDTQQMADFGTPIGKCDSGHLGQLCRVYLNEISQSNNPPPLPPRTRVDDTGVWRMTSKAWAGWLGGGWVMRSGFPREITPYAPPQAWGFFDPPYDLTGYHQVAEFYTTLKYEADSAGTKTKCTLYWSFSLIHQGLVKTLWYHIEERDPCPPGQTLAIP